MKPPASLDVLLHGHAIAHLRAAPAMELRYTSEVVSALGVGALCLSAALPVAAKPYRDSKPGTAHPRRAVEFWAEGLLPEGEADALPRAEAQLAPLLPVDLGQQTLEHLQQRAASPDG